MFLRQCPRYSSFFTVCELGSGNFWIPSVFPTSGRLKCVGRGVYVSSEISWFESMTNNGWKYPEGLFVMLMSLSTKLIIYYIYSRCIICQIYFQYKYLVIVSGFRPMWIKTTGENCLKKLLFVNSDDLSGSQRPQIIPEKW